MMSDNEEVGKFGEHKSLLQAISNLGKVQNLRKPNRNETTNNQNEFALVKNKKLGAGKESRTNSQPVKVNDIVEVLKKNEKFFGTSRVINHVKKSKHVLEKPLEKSVIERMERNIAFGAVQKKLMKWDALVAKNRSDEAQTFPLPLCEKIYIDTAAHAASLQRVVCSDLMSELVTADNKLKALQKERAGDTRDEVAEFQNEQKSLEGKLSREEFVARRKEMSYLKMRQAQMQAKAHMKNKVKSKKYHKLAKREKIKGQIKQFEQLQKNDPEAALERLNLLECNRIYERASLRHKNTGTWAKNLQMRAKYNKDVRQDLAEQLQISRELTRKKQNDKENDETIDATDIEYDTEMGENSFSPWIDKNTANIANETADKKQTNWRKYWLERNHNKQLLEDYQKDETDSKSDDINATAVKVQKKKLVKEKQTKPVYENGWLVEPITEDSTLKKVVPQTIDNIFENQEYKIARRLNSNLKTLSNVTKVQNKPASSKMLQSKEPKNKKDKLRNLIDLKFKSTSIERPIIDEELDVGQDNLQKTKRLPTNVSVAVTKENRVVEKHDTDVIDTKKITNIRLQKNTHGLYNLVDDADEEAAVEELNIEDQQMTINEAFGDDDIVADFKAEKSAETEIKNDELVLSMPGWGSWAGAGISQASMQAKAKRKRLILNQAQETKRADAAKQNVLINEKCSKELRSHLVTSLPFPFKRVKDFEASVRAPVSRDCVPETAFRMLTRPSIRTRKGQIIEPMEESELLKPPKYLRHEVDKRIADSAK